MSEEGQSSKKIKVVDRRWFSEDGSVRPDRPAPSPSGAAVEGAPSEPLIGRKGAKGVQGPTGAANVAPDASARPTTSPVFVELIATLAQQAELLILGAPGFPKQPEQAQRLIDFLAVLESKTRGNLSAEEAQILSNVLFQLRAAFVQKV